MPTSLPGPLRGGRLSYLFLLARDVAGMVRFYGETLGLPITYHEPERFAFVRLGPPGAPELAIYAGRDTAATERPHWFFVIDVPDLNQAVTELANRGLAVGPIEPVPFGRAATLSDPEGNVIELHEAAAR